MVPVTIIRVGENNVLGKIYINFRVQERRIRFILHFSFNIHKKQKDYKDPTHPKINFYIIFI